METRMQSLRRFFGNNYSRKDYLTVMEMVSDPSREEEFRQLLTAQWHEGSDEAVPDQEVENLLFRLQQRIVTEEIRTRNNKKLLYLLQKVAAILFLPLLLGSLGYFLFLTPQPESSAGMAEIECPEGVRTRFSLPDGTTGYLNSGSTLSYPVHFRKNRSVALTGEAFFQVKEDKKSPFTVETPHLAIRVTGTIFNVIAYQGETTEEVILESGSLQISQPEGTAVARLTANQKVKLDLSSGTATKSEVIASQYTGWTEGKLIFRDEDMGQVAQRLSRWYNAEILIADSRLLEFTFYATFLDEPLDEVLKLLAYTTPILYEEEKRLPRQDGSFPRRKITLRLNPAKVKKFI